MTAEIRKTPDGLYLATLSMCRVVASQDGRERASASAGEITAMHADKHTAVRMAFSQFQELLLDPVLSQID